MTADEMFEKIGYVKICDDEKVAYCNEQDEFDTYVIFDKIDKAIKYIKEKQKIQYKYTLSKIEIDELLKILEG